MPTLKDIWKRFIANDGKGRLFIRVVDKILTESILKDRMERYCPPHNLPHNVFGKPICDEPCHIHTTNWRYYSHHLPYCFITNCPHAREMANAHKIHKSRQK